MVPYKVFTDKEKLKDNKELVELHKRVIKTYLVSRSCRASIRKKFFLIYDQYISEKNILSYLYTPTRILVRALVLNKLEQVSIYITRKSNNKKPRKRRTNVQE